MENVCKIPLTNKMIETTQTESETTSELSSKRWAVISFEKCEASGLTYPGARERLAELDKKRIAGLCVVTDEAAARLNA